MATEIVTHDTKEAWLATRTKTVGASEMAKALGVEEGGLQIWAEKRGLPAEDLSGKPRVGWGLRWEGPICDAYAEEFSNIVKRPAPFTIHRSIDWPWLSCTPDAFVEDGPHLQIKTCDAYRKKEWDGEPPLKYQIQVQTELAVLERETAYLVVLFGGNELERFEVVRNEKFIAVMVAKAREFMDSVDSGLMPEIDGSLSTRRTLALLHPKDNGEEVELAWAGSIRDKRFVAVTMELKELEAERQYLENWFCSRIGKATYGVLPDCTTYSLKTQRTAHNGTTRVLRRKA